MIGQTLSALEGLRAKRAHKRLFQRTTSVPLERQHPCELILAQRACVGARFLQAVLTHVSVEGRLVSKPRTALRALVKLLPGVSS